MTPQHPAAPETEPLRTAQHQEIVMPENVVTVTMSTDAARAVLRAIEEDPDRTKWGHHQWLRAEAVAVIRRGLDSNNCELEDER